jgi:hypothetical protein
MLVLGITIYWGGGGGKRGRKKNCITPIRVEMAASPSIFVNPLQANFESKVHPVAYHKRTAAEVYLYSVFNLGARWGWVVNATLQSIYPRERDLVPNVQDAGWAPGQICTDAEYLTPTSIRSTDRPPWREPLYRLRHPGPPCNPELEKTCGGLGPWKRMAFLCSLKAGSYHVKYWGTTARAYFTGWEILNEIYSAHSSNGIVKWKLPLYNMICIGFNLRYI